MWEQIRSNRVRSVALVIVMGAVLFALGYFLGLYFFDSATAGVAIALVIWIIMSLVAYFQGDSILLGMAGARKISADDYPRLYNVVDEMKIASGLDTMPDVYIIDDPALNAFSTGRDSQHAAVAITSGLLQKLDRDELQGVMGHEVGHIKNRDVLLMALCAVLLGTIVILSYYASRFVFFGGGGRSRRGSSSGSGGGGQAIIFIVAIVLMILAPIFAYLIYFAVSRRREYLADASSALYTRYPEGLASALEKLAASTDQLKSANQATAPMYIVNPFRGQGRAATDLTATHPPISERIRILRSMAGLSYAGYEQAYEKATGSHIVPHSALAGGETLTPRPPSTDTGPVEPEIARARETSNVLWNMNNYKTIDCECGTRLRVPPGLQGSPVQCPHCGRIHQT